MRTFWNSDSSKGNLPVLMCSTSEGIRPVRSLFAGKPAPTGGSKVCQDKIRMAEFRIVNLVAYYDSNAFRHAWRAFHNLLISNENWFPMVPEFVRPEGKRPVLRYGVKPPVRFAHLIKGIQGIFCPWPILAKDNLHAAARQGGSSVGHPEYSEFGTTGFRPSRLCRDASSRIPDRHPGQGAIRDPEIHEKTALFWIPDLPRFASVVRNDVL